MNKIKWNLLLADDDIDDRFFFKDALEDLPVSTSLNTVADGVELMNFLLLNSGDLPNVLFLDLNMPRKSGFECLSEIKLTDKISRLPVIIFSTSLDIEVVNLLYEKGAHYYIRKPGDFFKLKKVILEALNQLAQNGPMRPTREKFILQP